MGIEGQRINLKLCRHKCGGPALSVAALALLAFAGLCDPAYAGPVLPSGGQFAVEGARVVSDFDPLSHEATIEQGQGRVGQRDGFSLIGHVRFLLGCKNIEKWRFCGGGFAGETRQVLPRETGQ